MLPDLNCAGLASSRPKSVRKEKNHEDLVTDSIDQLSIQFFDCIALRLTSKIIDFI
jgi:hypothetical protein